MLIPYHSNFRWIHKILSFKIQQQAEMSYFRLIMKSFLGLIFLFIFCTLSRAQKVYEFNSICQQAYQDITKLKINSGIALIEKAKKQNPDNLIPLLLESYVDFYVLFLNEDPKEYEIRYPQFSDRINKLQKGPLSSPFYNYCLSTVRAHKAATAIKFGKLWDAGWEFRKAYQLCKENKKKFPTFIANDLMYGTLQAVVGTIPNGYQWIAGLFGMKGSIKEGMKTVRGFVNSSDPWAKIMFTEAAFIYPYLLFYIENKKEEAFIFVQQKKLDIVNNHLNTYMVANLAINNKNSDFAQHVILNRNLSEEYLTVSFWDFELGFTKLYHLETREAAIYLESFLHNFKGKYYVKDAYQKLSWCYYLEGKMSLAENARKNILQKGTTDSDADKQALKDAKSGKWPNILLLKARLLSDGGYALDADKLLQGKTDKDFLKEEEKLEFAYRKARIFDDLGKVEEAIKSYLVAITLGTNRKEYFAARAALQTGEIYEKKGQKSMAIIYFQKCLDMEDHEYKNSLDQKAKSGIARCKGD